MTIAKEISTFLVSLPGVVFLVREGVLGDVVLGDVVAGDGVVCGAKRVVVVVVGDGVVVVVVGRCR